MKRAIAKHGFENFKKEVLFDFDNPQDMFAKEAELVNEEFCARSDTYNICPGGQGGFGYVNANGLAVHENLKSPQAVINAKLKSKERLDILRKDPEWVERVRKKQSVSQKDMFRRNGSWWTGRSHSSETIEKLKRKPKLFAEQNGSFGSMWITNGVDNQKIKRMDVIPEGWYKGRTMKGKIA